MALPTFCSNDPSAASLHPRLVTCPVLAEPCFPAGVDWKGESSWAYCELRGLSGVTSGRESCCEPGAWCGVRPSSFTSELSMVVTSKSWVSQPC